MWIRYLGLFLGRELELPWLWWGNDLLWEGGGVEGGLFYVYAEFAELQHSGLQMEMLRSQAIHKITRPCVFRCGFYCVKGLVSCGSTLESYRLLRYSTMFRLYAFSARASKF